MGWERYTVLPEQVIDTAEHHQEELQYFVDELTGLIADIERQQPDATPDERIQLGEEIERRRKSQDLFRRKHKAYARACADWLAEYDARGECSFWCDLQGQKVLRISTSDRGMSYIVRGWGELDGTGNDSITRHGAAWQMAMEWLMPVGDEGPRAFKKGNEPMKQARVEIPMQNGGKPDAFLTFQLEGHTYEDILRQADELRTLAMVFIVNTGSNTGAQGTFESTVHTQAVAAPAPSPVPPPRDKASVNNDLPSADMPEHEGQLPMASGWRTVARKLWGTVVEYKGQSIYFGTDGIPHMAHYGQWREMRANDHPQYGFSWYCPWKDENDQWVKFRLRERDLLSISGY